MKIITSLFASFFVLLIGFCSPVLAANAILVWPVYQTIEADQTGSALWLENRGESNVVLQIRVMAWKQQNQEEVYAEQQNVVASPPFATVAAGERQLIRLMRFNEVPPGKQDAYRIIIDEIPMANNEPTPNSTGLRLQMRYLLPLFVSGTGIWTQERSDKERDPNTASRPTLTWSKVKKDGKEMLVVRNTGIVHARLSNVYWGTSNDNKNASLVLSEGFLGYVLPGSVMSWPLPSGSNIPDGKALFAQLADNTAPITIPHGQ